MSPTAPIELLHRIDALPALPKAAVDAMAALRSDDSSSERCAELIARDQALAARTLKLANSAFYGIPRRVGSIRDAVHLLGRRTLGTMVTAVVVSQQFDPGRCPGFRFDAFWRHAVASAVAARAIARELCLDEELAFTCGLMHDVGRLALAAHLPTQLGQALALARAQDVPLHEVEREVLGTDHVDIGAAIVERWQLAPEVAAAVRWHHRPSAADAAAQPLALIVHAADAIAHALDLSGLEDEQVGEADMAAWTRLELSPAQYLRVFEQTESQVQGLCRSLTS